MDDTNIIRLVRRRPADHDTRQAVALARKIASESNAADSVVEASLTRLNADLAGIYPDPVVRNRKVATRALVHLAAVSGLCGARHYAAIVMDLLEERDRVWPDGAGNGAA